MRQTQKKTHRNRSSHLGRIQGHTHRQMKSTEELFTYIMFGQDKVIYWVQL